MHSNDVESDAELHQKAALEAGYALIERKGSGASNVCYSAATPDGKRVAFKIFGQGAQLERDARELTVMQACEHPNIARCIESGEIGIGGGRVRYVVEDLFEGGSLRDRMGGGALARSQIFDLGSQMIGAIAYLHDHKLIHRDIKPENILFDAVGKPVLTDFGIVRILGGKSLTSTSAPIGPGTFGFMPAEQYHNEKAMIDWRADQFALAVTLTVAALQIHPFGDTLGVAVNAIAKRESPTKTFEVSAKAAGLSVLIQMVQPYPVQRYNDTKKLAADWGGLEAKA